ncbi:MAG: alanine dehydrogenase [Sedimentibacter sp.]
MIIGVPKENKHNEFRVAAIPSSVSSLIKKGHTVYVEHGAGVGSGFSDKEYSDVGACMVEKKEVYAKAELLYKVKEIEPMEYCMLRKGQILFTYLHSNAHLEMTKELLDKGVIGIAYEDVDDDNHEYPLLSPMSILAGKGGFLAALYFSQSVHGGSGILLDRNTGVSTPKISIIGCGWSGVSAAELAASFGNKVTMLDVNYKAMEKAKMKLPVNVEFLLSNRENLEICLKESDVIINCILWDKTRKDHLVFKEDLNMMKKGAIIVDVACDDEGAIETCHSTTHDDPIYYEEGIMHYCVDNIPSSFSHTASVMLSTATLSYTLSIANNGVETALMKDAHLRRGLTYYYGDLTLKETADKHNLVYTDPLEAIKKHQG